MSQAHIFEMQFARIYPLYLQKIERKGRDKAELDAVIFWLTGYDAAALAQLLSAGVTVRQFFDAAPQINPMANTITGTICGVKVQQITDPLMQKIRWLDKLVDELSKGRPMDKILRSQ